MPVKEIIENAYKNIKTITTQKIEPEIITAVCRTITNLETGKTRVAEKIAGSWQINTWAKQAVLLYFRLHENKLINGSFTKFFDKVPLRFTDSTPEDLAKLKIRIVPPACVRHGAYVGNSTVLMPSFVNIGAYVGNGCMIDNWATVGSCAQIGNNVHLSMGVGIGGVLEPLQAKPTIIEDDCFIGANCQIVEGVIVEKNSVIGMGVNLGASTKIYHKQSGEITYGKIPAGSVVVPGTIPDNSNNFSLNAAIIIKQITEETRAKVSINELLRET